MLHKKKILAMYLCAKVYEQILDKLMASGF